MSAPHLAEGFEVPLEEGELRAYLKYRQRRDVISGKGATTPKPAADKDKDKDKDKKPFEDRTLLKALEYVRQEIKKVG